MEFKLLPNRKIIDPLNENVSIKDIVELIYRGHRNLSIINSFSGKNVTDEFIKKFSFNPTKVDIYNLYRGDN